MSTELPRPPAVATPKPQAPSVSGTETGTGVLNRHGGAQAGDIEHGRRIAMTAMDLAEARYRHEHGQPHRHEHCEACAREAVAEAARPVHYREAAASLRAIADADEKADPPIGGEIDYLRGWRHAANRLESVARDLEDEGDHVTTSPQGIPDEELQAFCDAAPERIDSPLWTHLDWSLWGTGLGDTFREPLASTMVAAIPADVRAHAEMVMAEFLKFRSVESPASTSAELRAEIKRLGAEVERRERQIGLHLKLAHEETKRADAQTAKAKQAWAEGHSAALAAGCDDEDQFRANLGVLLVAEEQRCQMAINENPLDPHLHGRLTGLQRARDIVTGDAVRAALGETADPNGGES